MFAISKVVKHVRPYLLKAWTKVTVPHPMVTYLFVQKEIGEIWGNWMMTLEDYDLEIKLAKIVCRKGFYKLVVEAQDKKDEVFKEIFYNERNL